MMQLISRLLVFVVLLGSSTSFISPPSLPPPSLSALRSTVSPPEPPLPLGPSVDLSTELQSSFLQYALSTILGRALPDSRDGLKPVHRRILFAMSSSQLNLSPGGGHRKCARVVGEVLGKFHPHGDMSVYDALVRMAQDFSTGTRLIDGHGNFGSIDDDPAAAMRYTECKLTKIAVEAMLDGVADKGVVPFQDNFDGNEAEPTVLPAKLPFLLLNGAAGIAVGMATNIPPHNLNELVDACVGLLAAREAGALELEDKELFRMVPGPDFPTGSLIMGRSGAKKLYETGNGGVVMRATTHVETKTGKSGKSGRSSIVITELPYQVNKSLLLQKIADQVNDKKIDGISDLRDESDRDGIRVVIELKVNAVPAVVENNLFKKTPMQATFSGNLLAIMEDGTTPQRFTLRGALDNFLDFRFETVRKKARADLDKVESRFHIVEGLIKALESVDYVIDVIRKAEDTNAAREMLMDESNAKLGLSREQADSVLKLQLGQLTRLNGDKLASERATLVDEDKSLNELLTNDTTVRMRISAEMTELKAKYGVPRRTRIEEEDGEITDIELIKNERSVIVVTRGGYIKRMPLDQFEAQRRGTRGKKASQGGQADIVDHCITCNDHDTLLFSSTKGVAFGKRAFEIPLASRVAKGVPLPSVLPISGDDVISSVLGVSKFVDNEFILMTTEQGWIKKTPLKAFENLSSRGLIIASLGDGDSLKWVSKCTDADDVLLGSRNGMATRYKLSSMRPTGRTSRGVRSMKLRPGDELAGMSVLSPNSEGEGEHLLALTDMGYGKRVPLSDFKVQARGGVGVISIKFKSDEDRVRCLTSVKSGDEILVISENGIVVRQAVDSISAQSRTATGVKVQKIDKHDKIKSFSVVVGGAGEDGEDGEGDGMEGEAQPSS